ncbi:MAG TPA: hypothetical protein VGR06_35115 [Actinophytocola sp.]|jgi:uncharacterized protein YukE|uniref:hypothetical protein n=1 Tax=Actinophytocola sp. TaxID=1872138 RepID=UPI002E05F1EF|nr:hypothetical protein [Actinophytocola sp.]
MAYDDTLRGNTGKIAGAEIYFHELISDLRRVVRDAENGTSEAGKALKAQGMAKFRRNFQQWMQEIAELERDLKDVNQKTQHTGKRMAQANRMTDELGDMFVGINRGAAGRH